jgi:hypothetical protein
VPSKAAAARRARAAAAHRDSSAVPVPARRWFTATVSAQKAMPRFSLAGKVMRQ